MDDDLGVGDARGYGNSLKPLFLRWGLEFCIAHSGKA